MKEFPMRHPDRTILTRLAAGDPVAAEARAHADSCETCRRAVESLKAVWTSLQAADPAARLSDAPIWPGVLAAVESPAASGAGRPTLVPAWRFALADLGRSPLAYAAAAALVLGIGGGHAAGRALLGAPAAAEAAPAWADAVETSNVSGLSEGSLAWSYLEEDLSAIEAELESAPPSGAAASSTDSTDDGGAR
jgi:hypothetical protein